MNKNKKNHLIFIFLWGVIVAKPSYGQLEEVVVTAQKRSQSLQEIPISIAAFTNEDIKKSGAKSLQDLSEFVVGAELYDDRGAGQPTWVIRGVGLADYNANNTPTAAIYYDELYLGSNAFGGIGLYDIERVEVLKGAQGGLYGRNTSGGAVRVISSLPALGEGFQGSVNIATGSWGSQTLQAAVGLGIGERLGFRFAVTDESGGGWQDTLATTKDDGYGDREFFASKLSMLLQFNEYSEILVKYEAGKDNSEAPLSYNRAVYDSDQSFCESAKKGRFDPRSCLTWYNATEYAKNLGVSSGISPDMQKKDGSTVMSQPINQLDNKFQSLNLQYRWETDDLLIALISGLIDYEYEQVFDYDASPLNLASEDSSAKLKSFSHEIRIQSNGNDIFSWIIGLNYAEDKDDEYRYFDATDNLFVLPISGYRGFVQTTNSWSSYGQFEWMFSDRLKLNGSLRYTDEEKALRDAYLQKDRVSNLPPSLPSALMDVVNLVIGKATGIEDYNGESRDIALKKNWSGHVGLDFFYSDDVMFFGKVTSGLKSGGFFGGLAINKELLDPYEEEKVIAYEIGLKSTILDQSLRVNSSIFYYDYKGIQGYSQDISESTGTPIMFLDNIGDGEYKGAEFELQWRPIFLAGFEAVLGISWLDAVITDSNTIVSRSDGESVNVEGMSVPQAPDLSYMVSLSYEFIVVDDLLFGLNSKYSWRDDLVDQKSSLGMVDLAGLGIHEYGLLSARVYLQPESRDWEVYISGANLTGEDYWRSATTDGLGSFTSVAGQPASWAAGVSISW